MDITIVINEKPNGNVEVHVKQHAGYVTTREGRYADEISKDIKEHLKTAMPRIVQAIISREKN